MWRWEEDINMRRCIADLHFLKNPLLRRSREKDMNTKNQIPPCFRHLHCPNLSRTQASPRCLSVSLFCSSGKKGASRTGGMHWVTIVTGTVPSKVPHDVLQIRPPTRSNESHERRWAKGMPSAAAWRCFQWFPHQTNIKANIQHHLIIYCHITRPMFVNFCVSLLFTGCMIFMFI